MQQIPEPELVVKEEKEKKGVIVITKRNLLIFLLILLLLLGSCTGFLYWAGKNGKNIPLNPFGPVPTPTARVPFTTPDLDPNAGDLQGPTPPPRQEGSMPNGISIPGYPWATVKARSKHANVALYNPANNNCYFIFDIILVSTGETLYSSRMVPPNQAINGFDMTKGLSKGNHDIIIRISTYHLETLEPRNGADVNTIFMCV